jgi:hypothetical protein
MAMGISLLGSVAICALLLKEKKIKRVMLLMTVILVGVSLAFILLHSNRKENVQGTLFELEKKTRITYTATSLSMRTQVWKDGLRTFLAKPALGHGAGAFEYGYRQHFSGGVYTRYSHSAFLKIAIELGIVGILAFLFFLWGSITCLKKTEGYSDHFVFIILISAACGFLFSILDFAFDTPAFFITFFLITSVSMGTEKIKQGKVAKLLLFFMVCVLIFSFFFTGKSNLSKKSIENGSAYEDMGLFNNAYQAYSDSIKEMPLNQEGFMRIESVLFKKYSRETDTGEKNKTKQAIEYYLGIMAKSNKKDSELMFTQGVGYEILNNRDKAELYYKEALLYYPASVYYALRCAKFYLAQENHEEAKRIIASMSSYKEKYRIFRNPNGVFFYLLEDLGAEMEYTQGNHKKALAIAQNNLKDAEENMFVTSSVKAREFISRDRLILYLKERLRTFEK